MIKYKEYKPQNKKNPQLSVGGCKTEKIIMLFLIRFLRYI